MKISADGGKLTIFLECRIDAVNAEGVGKEISDALAQHGAEDIIFDAEGLEYISSAGLRVLLKVQKRSGSWLILPAGQRSSVFRTPKLSVRYGIASTSTS